MPPPKYVPRPTEPPRDIVGLDGVTRRIVYYVDGDVKSKRVLDVPLKPCPYVFDIRPRKRTFGGK